MPLQIIHQDITKIKCNAIVNPTDAVFSGSGGTDLAVHTAAGAELDEECSKFGTLHQSEIVVTKGYRLQQKIYDIFEINSALYKYDQVCLGC